MKPGLPLLYLLTFVCLCAEASPLPISPNAPRIFLGQHLMYLEDPTGGLGLNEVRQERGDWVASRNEVPSFGFTRSAFWFKVQLTADTPQRRLVELAYPRLDHINVYVIQNGRLVDDHELGDQHPFRSRPIHYTNFVFPIELAAGGTTEILVRLETASAMQLPMILWEPDTLLSQSHESSFLDGLIYGFLIALAAYHLMLFLQIREASFLYLTFYTLSISIALGTLGGKSFAFLWPDAIGWNETAFVFMGGCSVLFSCLFTNSTLLLHESRPRLASLLLYVGFAGLGIGLLAFALPYDVAVQAFLLVTSCSLLLNILAYVLRSLDRYQPAYCFLGAALTISMALAATGMDTLGLMPNNRLAANTALIGTCLHFLLFAMALATRLKLDRSAREQAQQQNAETQQLLLAAQHNLTERLEELVTERTAALRAANRKLQNLSNTDALTGLRNRRHFNEVLEVEFKRSRRTQSPLSLLIIDIDHFKRINDTYGHPFGDQCLSKVGEILNEGRRAADLCARYGGEEFVLLLPDTPLSGATIVAENLRNLFAASELENDGVEVSITVSIGVAALSPSMAGDALTLLKAADQQLYKAKEAGRNSVIAAEA